MANWFARSSSTARRAAARARSSDVASLGFDLPRAALTVVLVLLAGRAVLVALRRASRRAAFDAPVVFEDAEGGKLADAGPVELRCGLKRGDNFLTETWAYRVTP